MCPGGSLLKKEVQTALLDSIDSILLIVFISGKKIPSPLFKTVFRGHNLSPGGSLLKKRGANDIIGLD